MSGAATSIAQCFLIVPTILRDHLADLNAFIEEEVGPPLPAAAKLPIALVQAGNTVTMITAFAWL